MDAAHRREVAVLARETRSAHAAASARAAAARIHALDEQNRSIAGRSRDLAIEVVGDRREIDRFHPSTLVARARFLQ